MQYSIINFNSLKILNGHIDSISPLLMITDCLANFTEIIYENLQTSSNIMTIFSKQTGEIDKFINDLYINKMEII